MRSSKTTKHHSSGGVLLLLASIFCAVLLFSSGVSCYRPPRADSDSGESEQQSTPRFLDSNNVHVVATLWAIDLLEADGQSFEAHATLKKHFDTLVQGLREAETSGGVFSFPQTKQGSSDDSSAEERIYFHRNTFGHFVDVQDSTPKGLEFSDAVTDETLAELFPSAGQKEHEPRDVTAPLVQDEWKLDAARGPNVALTDLIDWHYALAVAHMKEGEVTKAMLNLGYVAHFVQDATVPQRASKDFWLQSEAHLIAYENECEELLRQKEIAPPSEGGVYKTSAEWKPHDYVKFAAASAMPFAKSFLESSDFNKTNAFLVANELVPLSAKLTAGLFIRFFYGWYTERFTLIALSIDQVQAAIEKASLYPTAIIGDEETARAQRRASISLDDSSAINPNEGFASYGWVWTKWIDQSDYMEAVRRSNVRESLSEQEDDYDVIDEPWIPITIELRNRNDADLELDISPDAGDKTLKLRYGLTSGHVWLSYHLYPNPSVHPTLMKLKNNHSETSEHSFFNMLRSKSKELYEHFSFIVQGTTGSEDDNNHSAKLQLSIARFPKVQTGLTIGKKLGLITAAATSLSMAALALVVIIYTRRKEAASAVTTQADWTLLPSSASSSSSSSSLEGSTSVDPLWPQHLFAVLSERDLLIEDLQEQDSSQQFHHQYYIV